MQSLGAHQPLNPAPAHDDPFEGQQPPDLTDSADPTALVRIEEDPLDLHDQLRVAQRSWRGRAGLERLVGGRGNRHAVLGQHAADRLDPEPVTVVVDEPDYQGSRGSSSRAKKLEAANRISLARFTPGSPPPTP